MEQVVAFLWKADELYKKKEIKIIYYLDVTWCIYNRMVKQSQSLKNNSQDKRMSVMWYIWQKNRKNQLIKTHHKGK